MYVIVEIAGQQFKAEKGRKLYVHRLQGEENSSVSFDKVLLTDNDGQVKVGAPVVKGAAVKCKILKHLKDDKVLVFKKKRRPELIAERYESVADLIIDGGEGGTIPSTTVDCTGDEPVVLREGKGDLQE